MEGCTFKPNICGPNKKPEVKSRNVNGYDKVVERYRTVAEEKKKKQELMDK